MVGIFPYFRNQIIAMYRITFVLVLLMGSAVYAQTWTQLNDIPAPYWGRNHPATFSIDGYGYVITGFSGQWHDDVWKYDPSIDDWTQMGDFPGAGRSYAYGVAVAGKGYVGFGAEFDSAPTVFNDWYEYDPTTDSWTTLSACPCDARQHPAMVSIENKIYVGLGDDLSNDMKDWWEYDIPSDTWTQKTDFPATERHHPPMSDSDIMILPFLMISMSMIPMRIPGVRLQVFLRKEE
jgi:N-acetylneuraminic acid mutarotase